MARITRRLFTSLPGVITPAGLAMASPRPAAGAPAPQQTTSGNTDTDLLERRRQNVRRASEELREFELAYTDEPLFHLVVR
jgi:hypothetical protein